MRILHFCNYADQIGGAEVYAHAVVEALRGRGHEVALFGASPEAEIDRPGLRVIQRPLYDPQRLVKDAAALNAVREYVQRFRPEVLHVHNVFSVALEVLQYLLASGSPVIHTVHDFQLLCPNSWCVRGDGVPCPGGAGAQCFEHGCEENYPYDAWSVLLSVFRQRIASTGASIAVAPSAYLVERLRAHGWPDVRQLPYFIDLPGGDALRPRTPHALLYVGRLQPEKGVAVLLEALPAVLAEIPDARLALIGDGTLADALRDQAARLGVTSSVRFLPKLSRADLVEHYATSSLCILPSVWTENSPLVAYECLRTGLPMVGSHLGGIPELLEGCGFTFTPRDAAALSGAIIRFLRLPLTERERLSEAARARARSFQRDSHVDVLEALYSEVTALGNMRPTPAPLLDAELLSALSHVGAQRPPSAYEPGPMQILRSIARSLGLPKVLRS